MKGFTLCILSDDIYVIVPNMIIWFSSQGNIILKIISLIEKIWV
jgi:hypothetical protein